MALRYQNDSFNSELTTVASTEDNKNFRLKFRKKKAKKKNIYFTFKKMHDTP